MQLREALASTVLSGKQLPLGHLGPQLAEFISKSALLVLQDRHLLPEGDKVRAELAELQQQREQLKVEREAAARERSTLGPTFSNLQVQLSQTTLQLSESSVREAHLQADLVAAQKQLAELMEKYKEVDGIKIPEGSDPDFEGHPAMWYVWRHEQQEQRILQLIAQNQKLQAQVEAQGTALAQAMGESEQLRALLPARATTRHQAQQQQQGEAQGGAEGK